MNVNEAKENVLAHLHILPESVQADLKFLLEKFDATARELEELKQLATSWNRIENLPHEIWRNIENFEGIYQVSNFGRVKSLHWFGGRLINPLTNKKGYLSVILSKDGTTKHFKVHKLVAQAFLPNPDNKPIVHHRDGNRSNNCVENLEWVTHRENQQYSIQMGTKKFPLGLKFNNAKLSEDDVRYIRANFIPYDQEFGNSAFAKKFNVSKSAIYDVIHYKTYRDVE